MTWKSRLCRGCKEELVWCDSPETAVCDVCSNEHFEKLKEPVEELYKLNADISMKFVALKKEPTLEDMSILNQKIGKIIGDLRGVVR